MAFRLLALCVAAAVSVVYALPERSIFCWSTESFPEFCNADGHCRNFLLFGARSHHADVNPEQDMIMASMSTNSVPFFGLHHFQSAAEYQLRFDHDAFLTQPINWTAQPYSVAIGPSGWNMAVVVRSVVEYVDTNKDGHYTAGVDQKVSFTDYVAEAGTMQWDEQHIVARGPVEGRASVRSADPLNRLQITSVVLGGSDAPLNSRNTSFVQLEVSRDKKAVQGSDAVVSLEIELGLITSDFKAHLTAAKNGTLVNISGHNGGLFWGHSVQVYNSGVDGAFEAEYHALVSNATTIHPADINSGLVPLLFPAPRETDGGVLPRRDLGNNAAYQKVQLTYTPDTVDDSAMLTSVKFNLTLAWGEKDAHDSDYDPMWFAGWAYFVFVVLILGSVAGFLYGVYWDLAKRKGMNVTDPSYSSPAPLKRKADSRTRFEDVDTSGAIMNNGLAYAGRGGGGDDGQSVGLTEQADRGSPQQSSSYISFSGAASNNNNNNSISRAGDGRDGQELL